MLNVMTVSAFAIAALGSQVTHDDIQVIHKDLARGKKLVDDHKGKEAIPVLTDVIAKDPKNAEAYYYRGCAYDSIDEKASAIEDFTKAISLDKMYVDAYVGRAYAYFVTHDSKAALADFNKAIEIDRKSVNAYLGRGVVYCKSKEYKKTVADFTTARDLDPKNDAARSLLSDMLATCIDDNVRDGKKALENATEACKLTNYNELMPLQSLAASYAELGKFEEAVKWQKKALALLPKDLVDAWVDRLHMFEKGKPLRYENPILGR